MLVVTMSAFFSPYSELKETYTSEFWEVRAFHKKGNSSYSIILLSVPLKKHNFSDLLLVAFSYRKKNHRKAQNLVIFFLHLHKWSLDFIGFCLLFKPVFAQLHS